MPVEALELTTREPELAHRVLNQLYATDRPIVFLSDGAACHFRLSARTAGPVGLSEIWYTMPTRGHLPPNDWFMALTTLDGHVELAAAGGELRLRHGDVARFDCESGMRADWDDVGALLVNIPFLTVARVAETIGATDPLRFDGMSPVSAVMARQWRDLTRFVHRQLLLADSPLGHALVQAQVEEMVARAALAVFPNSAMTASYRPGAGWMAPAALRRALAFIESHAAQPITVADIAAAAGTSPRAVQQNFRRRFDTTPTAYLRSIRLAAVHRELRRADPSSGIDISELAGRWGFPHSGQFEAWYRRRFGESPEQTLHGD
ncbi:AraC family transcriptional regulator [Nocardia yamanashiensis]|uniref:AraC family transcriptional regulator n=1 Tax=Nocardia yamanashiensis TaxID=209247 RepID=UPI001E31C901|nr:AraC family transcriptional regulator [Nocardia yamanashiensis]UGT43222.1 AraC family transcriptional regulator [Nocardia yamanashiensis]